MTYTNKFLRLILGQMFLALGIEFRVQANIGLAPWDTFSMGLSLKTGMTFGNAVVLTGVVLVAIALLIGEKVGLGTIANSILIGKFYDLFHGFHLIPEATHQWTSLFMVLLALYLTSLGIYFYVGAALGCGPRDVLMVATGKHLTRIPIGFIRSTIEGIVLTIGWLLGAKVGLGTVISVFGIGIIMQVTFKLLRFNVKSVKHENLVDTFMKRIKL